MLGHSRATGVSGKPVTVAVSGRLGGVLCHSRSAAIGSNRPFAAGEEGRTGGSVEAQHRQMDAGCRGLEPKSADNEPSQQLHPSRDA